MRWNSSFIKSWTLAHFEHTFISLRFKICYSIGGVWMVAQSVKQWTLDFSSGHDLIITRWSPSSGSALTAWSLLGILSLSPSLSVPLLFALSLSK